MLGRNPLKSGQCFLLSATMLWRLRVRVSRNPLKSGQCFLQNITCLNGIVVLTGRNPLKSGQCFLQILLTGKVSPRPFQSQSPQIGSMFLTTFFILKERR